MISDELRRQADEFIDLAELQAKIAKPYRRGANEEYEQYRSP